MVGMNNEDDSQSNSSSKTQNRFAWCEHDPAPMYQCVVYVIYLLFIAIVYTIVMW